jgi:cobalt-precorrin 5A hydrolase
MTDFRAAVKTVNQMLVSGKRVGCGATLNTEALSRCDQRGFIPVRTWRACRRSTR